MMANVVMHVLSVDANTRVKHAAATHATVERDIRSAFPALAQSPVAPFAAARAVLDAVDHVRQLYGSLFLSRRTRSRGGTTPSSTPSTEEDEENDPTLEEATTSGTTLPVHLRKLPGFGAPGELTVAAVVWHACLTRALDLYAGGLVDDGESVGRMLSWCCVSWGCVHMS